MLCWAHSSVTCLVDRMAWSSGLQKESRTAAQSALHGEQLGHYDVGIMLGALVDNALGVDVGVALGALVGNVLGRQDGLVFWLAERDQDGHPVGTDVGDSDNEQLGHCDVGIMLRALVG